MKLLQTRKHSTERGSLIVYAFLALIILGAIAGVSTYVTHNVQTNQRRQSYSEAYNYSEAGLMLAAADVNSAFTNSSASFFETLSQSNLSPYAKDDKQSTYNTLVYARTITSPFTNQPVEIELSMPNETEPSKVTITSRANVRGVSVTNTAVVDLTFAYRAVIVSDNPGSSSGTISEANAMLGNVVIPTADKGSTLTVDGRIIANGRANVGSIGLASDMVSMTNYGTAKQVPDYTKSDSTDQLFDFKRLIAASELLGTHYKSIDEFLRVARKEEVFEGIIVVDVRREDTDTTTTTGSDKDDGKDDKDDSKSDKDDGKSDTDDSKSDKDDSKDDKKSGSFFGPKEEDVFRASSVSSKDDKDDKDDSKDDKDDSKDDKDDSKSDDKDDSKSDKDDDDGKDDKDDPGIDRVDLPNGIYVRGTLIFNYVYDAVSLVKDDKDDSKSDKDDSKTDTDDSKSDKDDSSSDKEKDNKGHGNNEDGMDVDNPGKKPGVDASGDVDDEKKTGKSFFGPKEEDVFRASSVSAKDDKDDSKSDDKDDSKSDKDDSGSDKDDGKSDKDDGKCDPGKGYKAWNDADAVLDGVSLYINWIDLDTLNPADPTTYTSAYPPTYKNPEMNPVNLNMVPYGYENFTADEDLPALMFNGGSMSLRGLLDICGVIYSSNYIDIQNDKATTQYIKGTIFGGGGVYIENNTASSRTVLSFDSRAVDNLATKFNRGMTASVKHRD